MHISKKILLSALIIASASVATVANAHNLFNRTAKHALNHSANASTLFTLHVIAEPEFDSTATAYAFLGTSTVAPCSDLKQIGTDDFTAHFVSSDESITSEEAVEDFGGAVTCIRSDLKFPSGRTYTTGNIALTWDAESKTYTSAMPSDITIDISKQ
jgi:hypothetical protein